MCGRFALAGEVVDQHDPSIEKPEVVARKGQVRGSAAWQPTHLLATDDVHEGAVVFISNVLTERLGHDSCAPDLDTPARHVGCRLIPGVPPGLPVRRIPTLPVAPCGEIRVAAHVAITHLQMHRRPLAGAQHVLDRLIHPLRQRQLSHHSSSPAGTCLESGCAPSQLRCG